PPRMVPNVQLIEKAVQLIKEDFPSYRIEIKADSVALRDYASMKQERVEAIQALTSIFQTGMPMVQALGPKCAQFLLEVGKWLLASTKGSQQIEGVFDRFATELEAMANQPPPPPPPDPKMQAAQVKAQAEMGKAQANQQQTQLDTQAHVVKTGMDMQVARTEHQMAMEKLAAETQASIVKQANTAPGVPAV
ncbi:MAG TPA: hypothetical protein VFH83_01525, partial [Spirochaetia bacterium]|nr:hypothetical protein [Spirochaetia bacterium]